MHPLTFTDACEHSEVVHTAYQQWQQQREKEATFWTDMQIFMSAACRLSLITGENAQLIIVDVGRDLWRSWSPTPC